jgi:hypothetical protein
VGIEKIALLVFLVMVCVILLFVGSCDAAASDGSMQVRPWQHAKSCDNRAENFGGDISLERMTFFASLRSKSVSAWPSLLFHFDYQE